MSNGYKQQFKQPVNGHARRCFSTIGLSLTAMMLVYIGVQYLTLMLAKRNFADHLSTAWLRWGLSFLPLYLVGVPTFALLVRRVPVECPPERKK